VAALTPRAVVVLAAGRLVAPANIPKNPVTATRQAAKVATDRLESQPAFCDFRIGIVHTGRPDSLALANGMIRAGLRTQVVQYVAQNVEELEMMCRGFDGLLLRISESDWLEMPNRDEFNSLMNSLLVEGQALWPSPLHQQMLGLKGFALIGQLPCVLQGTKAFGSAAELHDALRSSLVAQPQIVKASRGSDGEGVWLIVPKAPAQDLDFIELSDLHRECHTLEDFVRFCQFGNDGTWASASRGAFRAPGCAEGTVEQRPCDWRCGEAPSTNAVR
jgi:hypothetical protein